MKTIFVAMLLLPSICLSGEFNCEDDGSYLVVGKAYFACGLGEAPTEAQARAEASKSAQDDYNRSYPNTWFWVEPRRTVCKFNHEMYKCYQLTAFHFAKKPQ